MANLQNRRFTILTIRVIDRLEDFYLKVQQDPTVSFVKSKVANIVEDKEGNPAAGKAAENRRT